MTSASNASIRIDVKGTEALQSGLPHQQPLDRRDYDHLFLTGRIDFEVTPGYRITLTAAGIRRMFGPNWCAISLLAQFIASGYAYVASEDMDERYALNLPDDVMQATIHGAGMFGAVAYTEGFARVWGNA